MAELRTLLPKEKEIVKRLVELRKNSSNRHLSDFHSAKMLEQIIDLNFVALVWDREEKETVRVYYVPDNNKEEEAQAAFFNMCDYLFLLEELDSAGYITIQNAKSKNVEHGKRYVYNRTKYEQVWNDSETFFRKLDDDSGVLYMEKMNYCTFNVGIVDYLERYIYDKIIYPRASLEDYVSNKCKTIESRRDSKQRCMQGITLFLSIVAIIISVVVPTHCSTKIESKDLHDIATRNFIKEKMPEQVTITTSSDIADTLNRNL